MIGNPGIQDLLCRMANVINASATQDNKINDPHPGPGLLFDHIDSQEDTQWGLCPNLSVLINEHNSVEERPYHKTQLDAFVYIIIVLVFYAFAMIFLMIKYIRRERDASDANFYYVQFAEQDTVSHKDVQIQESMETYELQNPDERTTLIRDPSLEIRIDRDESIILDDECPV